jgi:hypothetical protein
VPSVKVVLWIIVGLVALDVVILGLLALGAAEVRRRSHRRAREPSAWTEEFASGGGGRVIPLPRADRDDSPVRLVPPVSASRRRSPARRFAMVGLITLMAGAGTAIASPSAREVMATALSAVVSTLSPVEDQQTSADAPEDLGPGEALNLRDGRRPQTGASPGSGPGSGPERPGRHGTGGSADDPSSDPRPTGVPPPVVGPPTAPSAVRASTASSSQLDILWADVATETGYRIERQDDELGWRTVGTVGRNVTQFTDSGLSSGTTYFYRLFATNAQGDSPPSGVTSATTTVDPASPPTLSARTDGPGRIALSWANVEDELGYTVERSDGSGGWIVVATTGQDVTDYVDVGLAPDTTYQYRVLATNAGGDSPPSEIVSVTTVPAEEHGGAETSDGGAETSDGGAETSDGGAET